LIEWSNVNDAVSFDDDAAWTIDDFVRAGEDGLAND
jgi:hypothetical protein